jgi:peptidoglycan/LPS O-acetylase OafA/YrhL
MQGLARHHQLGSAADAPSQPPRLSRMSALAAPGIPLAHSLKAWLTRALAWSGTRGGYPLGYSAALDGMRGILTLGVLVAHTRGLLFPGAIVYMDIFFVMSGFLITSLLLSDYRKRGRIDFKKFYMRRFMRLFPALALLCAAIVVVAWFFSREFELRLIDAAVAFFYISNYWRAVDGIGLWYTSHTWSLSIEEQFYVLWPLTFALLMRYFGASWRTVAIILTAAAGFALWRIWLTYNGATIPRLYNAFDTRADALLIGCALAVVLRIVDLASYPRACWVLAWSLVPLAAFALWCGFNITEHMRWYYYVMPLFGAIPGAIAVAALLQPKRIFMHTLYEWPAFVFCGRICYGLYLWHFPVFSLLRGGGFRYYQVFLIGWPIAFALAIGSYYLIERHFMRARPV